MDRPDGLKPNPTTSALPCAIPATVEVVAQHLRIPHQDVLEVFPRDPPSPIQRTQAVLKLSLGEPHHFGELLHEGRHIQAQALHQRQAGGDALWVGDGGLLLLAPVIRVGPSEGLRQDVVGVIGAEPELFHEVARRLPLLLLHGIKLVGEMDGSARLTGHSGWSN